MSQQIEYRSGQPRAFVATRTFDLGTTGLKAMKGVEINFDGSQATIAGHPPVMLPTLRGAIRMGWLVLAEQYDAGAAPQRPVSAGVQVRPAEGGNPMDVKEKITVTTETVEAEEREVGNVAAHAAGVQARNTGNYRRQDGSMVTVEPQDGVEVRKVSTPTKWETDLEKTSVSEAIRQAESVKVTPGQGQTREEMEERMTPAQQAQYAYERAARMATHDPEGAARVVAQIGKSGNQVQEREGFTITGSVGGGTEIADMGGTGVAGPNQITVTESEGIKMTNTNGPGTVKRMKPGALAPAHAQDGAQARQIAKAICPDFPDNYKFEDPIRKKIARLQADFDDRPDVIRAVAAADTDPAVRTRLIEEFPGVFG